MQFQNLFHNHTLPPITGTFRIDPVYNKEKTKEIGIRKLYGQGARIRLKSLPANNSELPLCHPSNFIRYNE